MTGMPDSDPETTLPLHARAYITGLFRRCAEIIKGGCCTPHSPARGSSVN
jgi:hypothetical protein